jgi:hypothetical protein
MASSYSTDLKLELMVTGEKPNQWGDITNTNLNLLQQAIAGFQSIALTSTNTTALSNDRCYCFRCKKCCYKIYRNN